MRRPPLQHPDLTWLFCQAEGEMGLRSSHGPLVDLALSGVSSGGSTHPLALSDKRLHSASEERRLRSRVSSLCNRYRLALWLAYGPQPWPREVRGTKAYGPWPGVLLLCPRAQRAFERALAARAARVPARALALEAPELARRDVQDQHCHRDASLDAVDALARRGLGEWLRSPTTLADQALLEQLRVDALALVTEAFEAYVLTGRLAFAAAAAEVRAGPSPRQERKRRRELVAVGELL